MVSRPEYLSKRSLARCLDFKEGAIDQLVRRGLLPPPLVIGGFERWRWETVDNWLKGASPETAANTTDEEDPYVLGVKNAKPSAARVPGHQ